MTVLESLLSGIRNFTVFKLIYDINPTLMSLPSAQVCYNAVLKIPNNLRGVISDRLAIFVVSKPWVITVNQ